MENSFAGSPGTYARPVAIRIAPREGDQDARSNRLDPHRRCWTDDAFAEALLDPATTRIVWEVSRRSRHGEQALVAIRRAVPRIPILLRADLRVPGVSGIIMELARTAGDLTISLAGTEEFDVALDAWLTRPSGPAADQHILRRVAPVLRHPIETPLVAAILAKRRMRVRTLAGVCGWSVRTLQLRLQLASLPRPRVLLGWAMALHTSWRMETGCSVKQAAADAGFPDGAQLSNYLWRNVHQRPTTAVRAGGFWSQLDQFSSLLGDIVRERPSY